jgi:MFS superfamily sulfate permease-like transporter
MNFKFFFSDIKSGIVVFLVALPLCLGIAMACDVPLVSGLIAGIVGGIVVTSISNSKYSVSGPAAGLTAIVIAAMAELKNFEYFIAAVVIAGAIQIILGLIKAGGISNYIPNAVVKGMLAGIGIILIIKQFPHIVGYDADPEGDLYFEQGDGHNSISDLYYMINYITPGSLLIGLISFVLIIVCETRFYKKNKILSFVPGPLLVVLCGILLNILFRNNDFLRIGAAHLVDLPKMSTLSDLTGNFVHPDFSKWLDVGFWKIVITIALVASLETLLNIEAIEKLDPEKTQISTNRELVAQGAGNIIAGFMGGLPITSVIVRSSANLNAGAKTKLSTIFHAVLLFTSLFFFPDLLESIPNSALAVILIVTGHKLARPSQFKHLFKMGQDQFLPFLVTITVMLLTDLLKGVAAGIVVSLFFIIRFNVRSSVEVIEDIIDGRRNYLIRLPQHITFFNKGFISDYLNHVKKGSRVIIDGSINKSTDKDVREVLADFIHSSKQNDIDIQFVKYSLDDERKQNKSNRHGNFV